MPGDRHPIARSGATDRAACRRRHPSALARVTLCGVRAAQMVLAGRVVHADVPRVFPDCRSARAHPRSACLSWQIHRGAVRSLRCARFVRTCRGPRSRCFLVLPGVMHRPGLFPAVALGARDPVVARSATEQWNGGHESWLVQHSRRVSLSPPRKPFPLASAPVVVKPHGPAAATVRSLWSSGTRRRVPAGSRDGASPLDGRAPAGLVLHASTGRAGRPVAAISRTCRCTSIARAMHWSLLWYS